MAKNKKSSNIKLEQEELKPIVIGVFESRKKSSVGIVLILTTFVLVVLFLPQISEFIDGYLNPEVPTTPSVEPEKPVVLPPGEDDDPDASFYAYEAGLKIQNEDITVGDFVVDVANSVFSYTVTNNMGATQNLEELNYYLEIYDINQTLLERVKLADSSLVLSGAFVKYDKNISVAAASQIGYLVLVKKSITDYPLVTLTNNEEGVGSLVCTRAQEQVTYKFQEDLLKEVSSLVTLSNTDANYDTIYQDYKTKSGSYSGQVGVNSTWIDHATGFSVTTNVNLNEASRMYIFNADTFKLDTEPKVVKFEMEAQGFICE